MGGPAPVAAVTELLSVAEEAALAAGALLRERFEAGVERALRTKSTPTDLVSEADLASEAAIRGVLAQRRPDDAVLGEEGGRLGDAGALLWVVDPLDGTANFLQGIPAWCVSVAVRDGDDTLAGTVLDPLRGELFSAGRDGEARLGDAVLGGSACATLAEAIVGTGFAYDAAVRAAQGEVVARVLPRVGNLRRTGACALDLAWAAAGRLDAFYERAVQEWDIAAGELLCMRAGLVVERLSATDHVPTGILAAPAALADDLRGLVG